MTSRKAIERFNSSGGQVVGALGMVLMALVVLDVLVEWRTREGLVVAAGAVGFGVVIWVGLVRPSVVAYERELVLRNLIRDVHIPWELVSGVEFGPMLTVEADGTQHRAVGLSATRRQRRSTAQVDPTAQPGQVAQSGSAAQPESDTRAPRSAGAMTHARNRIKALSEQYQAQAQSEGQTHPATVTKTWAVPEFVVFAGAVLVTVFGALTL